MNVRLDFIGDVHGELPALEALGRHLGYAVDDGWRAPEGRFPVFLGDLVDRGAHSLEVAQTVKRLVEERRAFCIMGNHEYNLAAWHLKLPGYTEAKTSNRPTIDAIERDPRDGEAWRPVLEWFAELPVGLALPDLRVIHACWHKGSLEQAKVLARAPGQAASHADAFAWVADHVALRSPFEGGRLRAGLPGDTSQDEVIPHEDLMKGYEVPADVPFEDVDGKRREYARATWWLDGRTEVLDAWPQVFGHYWGCPPIDGEEAPPHPPGHRRLKAWVERLAPRVPDEGRRPLRGDHACIDFHGLTRFGDGRACIGALRWPEREIAWATAPRTGAYPTSA